MTPAPDSSWPWQPWRPFASSRLAGLAWVLSIAAAISPARADEPAPVSVDPALRTVLTSGSHRLLEYRLCSLEHCWSKAFVQWLDPTGGDPRTTEIAELGYGKAIESASWSGPDLNLLVVPSHGGFEPYTLIVRPSSPGSYSVRRK